MHGTNFLLARAQCEWNDKSCAMQLELCFGRRLVGSVLWGRVMVGLACELEWSVISTKKDRCKCVFVYECIVSRTEILNCTFVMSE